MGEITEKEKRNDEQARESCNCSLCANLAEFITGREIVLTLEVTLDN